jgi:hypothetical protein
MKTIENLKSGDYIAFGFNYNGGEPKEIMVSNITSVSDYGILVHFMYGHHSLSEYVKKENIIAIGNPEGKSKIRGWNGNFDVVNRNHKLINEVISI